MISEDWGLGTPAGVSGTAGRGTVGTVAPTAPGEAVFQFELRTLIRTVTIDGEPWFVARDVAAALSYVDPTSAIRAHCKGVAIHHPLSTAGGMQTVRVISEPDVLRMIVACRLPEAERFERFVFEEVLPSVRRTGSYVAPMSEDEIVHQALAITTRRAQALEARVAELEPVAAHAETFRQAEGLRTIADVANDFKAHCAASFPGIKVRHQDVFDHAGRLRIIIRADSVRHNQPTAEAIEAGWARPHRSTFDTRTHGQRSTVSTRLTPLGEGRLWDGLAAWLGAHGSLAIPN